MPAVGIPEEMRAYIRRVSLRDTGLLEALRRETAAGGVTVTVVVTVAVNR